LAARLSLDLIALLVNRPVVPLAPHREVRERRRPAPRPVVNVVTLSHSHVTARKATAAVAVLQRSANRRGNRSCPRGHFDDATIPGMLHHHAARVAWQA